jgi:hypothetical protein
MQHNSGIILPIFVVGDLILFFSHDLTTRPRFATAVAGCCEHGNENSSFIKGGVFLD